MTHRVLHQPFHMSAVLAAIALLGCGDDTSPTEEIAGTYVATTFIATPSGGSAQDVLAAGGSMTITLTAQGTTTGSLIVPASVSSEGEINESMAGTFTRTGDNVSFQQTADTFVKDATWSVNGNTLTTTFANADGSIQVTLSRS